MNSHYLMLPAVIGALLTALACAAGCSSKPVEPVESDTQAVEADAGPVAVTESIHVEPDASGDEADPEPECESSRAVLTFASVMQFHWHLRRILTVNVECVLDRFRPEAYTRGLQPVEASDQYARWHIVEHVEPLPSGHDQLQERYFEARLQVPQGPTPQVWAGDVRNIATWEGLNVFVVTHGEDDALRARAINAIREGRWLPGEFEEPQPGELYHPD